MWYREPDCNGMELSKERMVVTGSKCITLEVEGGRADKEVDVR